MTKTKTSITLFVLALLAMLSFGSMASAEEEAVTVNLFTPNLASIETDTTGFTAATGGAKPVRDTARALHGEASVLISGDGSGKNQGAWLASIFVPDNRETYTVSAYVYGKKGDKVLLNVQEKKHTGTSVVKNHYGDTFTLSGDGWERIHATVTMEEGDTLGVVIRNPEEKPFGIWVDQLQLELGDEPTPWQEPVQTKNLLTYNQATIAYNTLGYIPAKGSGFEPTLTVDDTVAWEGDTSLRMENPGVGEGEGFFMWPAFVPDNRGTYTASMYIKGEPGTTLYFVLEEKGPSGTGAVRKVRGENFTLSTNDWERHELTITMEEGDTLTLTLRNAEFFPATVWIDGVQIEEGPEATEWVAPAKPVAATR